MSRAANGLRRRVHVRHMTDFWRLLREYHAPAKGALFL